ncbi:hypothetical protein AAE478_002240 [Parahypoxylon ruwenzoriense]
MNDTVITPALSSITLDNAGNAAAPATEAPGSPGSSSSAGSPASDTTEALVQEVAIPAEEEMANHVTEGTVHGVVDATVSSTDMGAFAEFKDMEVDDFKRINPQNFLGQTLQTLPWNIIGIWNNRALTRHGRITEVLPGDWGCVNLAVDGGVHIRVHLEMLRALPGLYVKFNDPFEGWVHSHYATAGSWAAWKAVFFVIYGGDDYDLDHYNYETSDFVEALLILERWEAVSWTFDIVTSLLEFFAQYAVFRRNRGVNGGQDPLVQDALILDIQHAYLVWNQLRPESKRFEAWAFGAFAFRAVDADRLISILPSLDLDFHRQITIAGLKLAEETDFVPDCPIFYDDY